MGNIPTGITYCTAVGSARANAKNESNLRFASAMEQPDSNGFGLYIGPWQEFKLARFREQALKQFKQEWKQQLAAQLAGGGPAPPGAPQLRSDAVDALIASLPGASKRVAAMLRMCRQRERADGGSGGGASGAAGRPPRRARPKPREPAGVARVRMMKQVYTQGVREQGQGSCVASACAGGGAGGGGGGGDGQAASSAAGGSEALRRARQQREAAALSAADSAAAFASAVQATGSGAEWAQWAPAAPRVELRPRLRGEGGGGGGGGGASSASAVPGRPPALVPATALDGGGRGRRDDDAMSDAGSIDEDEVSKMLDWTQSLGGDAGDLDLGGW
eukprot:g1017.t1